MAVKKKQTLPPDQQTLVDNILEEIRDLLIEHMSNAMEILEDSEKRTVTITHKTNIDCSESVSTTETHIRYAVTHTDVRSHEVDDPKQPRLPGVEPEPKPAALPAPKKKKKDEANAAGE